MAIANFIPEIWSASLLTNLRNTLVYANLANRNYEGEIANAGDTVHITSFADPAVRDYAKYATIQWDELSDATRALVITEADYFAFKVDDIDKRQALPGFMEESTRGAAYNLAAAADAYVAGLMVAGAANHTDGGVPIEVTTANAYDVLVEMRTALTRSNTPTDGRWVVVPPEFYAKLLKDERFIRADASGTTEGLRNGFVGRAAGFEVIESNVVPFTEGTDPAPDLYDVVAGHSIATTFAEQISKVKAVDLQDTFGEGVKGLHVYGGLVTRGENLATASVSIGADAGA